MDSALATLPLETLQTRLSEALNALHELTTGARVVMVNLGDRRAQYSESQAGELRTYINALQSAIAAKTAAAPPRAPIYLTF